MPEEQVPHEVEQERELVCPLRMINKQRFNLSATQSTKCIKEKCAWWNPYWGGCAISSLAKQLDLIRNSGLPL